MEQDAWKNRLAAIIRADANRAFLVALRATGSASIAEDAVQDAYLQMIKSPPKFQGTVQARLYYLKAVRGIAINAMKAFNNRKNREERYVRDRSVALPEDPVLKKETVAVLKILINALPVDESEAVSLRYEQELSLKETAKILSLPRETVASRTRKGLDRLKKRLAVHGLAGISTVAIGKMLNGMGVPPIPGLLAKLPIPIPHPIGSENLLTSASAASSRKMAVVMPGIGKWLLSLTGVAALMVTIGGLQNRQPDEPASMAQTVSPDISNNIIPVATNASPTVPLPGDLVHEDRFEGPGPDPFWEVARPLSQMIFGRHERRSGVVFKTGEAADGSPLQQVVELISGNIDFADRPLDFEVRRNGSKNFGDGCFRGFELFDDHGRICLAAKRGRMGVLRFGEGSKDAPYILTGTIATHWKVRIEPHGRIVIFSEHQNYERNMKHSFKNLRLRVFVKGTPGSAREAGFSQVRIQRIDPSTPQKTFPFRSFVSILHDERFDGNGSTNFWRNKAGRPLKFSTMPDNANQFSDSWLWLKSSTRKRSRKSKNETQLSELYSKSITLNDRMLIIQIHSAMPEFHGKGDLFAGVEVLDKHNSKQAWFQIHSPRKRRRYSFSQNKITLQIGDQQRTPINRPHALLHSIRIRPSGQISLNCFGEAHGHRLPQPLKKFRLRFYVRAQSPRDSIRWAINGITIQQIQTRPIQVPKGKVLAAN